MSYFMIDKVTELDTGENVRGVKNVTLTDEILHDHFPDHPIVPCDLILESIDQLSGFLLEMTFIKKGAPFRRALMMQVRNAKFYETCGPGDTLDVAVRIESLLDAAAEVSATVHVSEKRVVRATLTFAMTEVRSERILDLRRYIYRLWTRDLNQEIYLP